MYAIVLLKTSTICIAILNNEVAALLRDYYTEVRHYNNIIVNTEM